MTTFSFQDIGLRPAQIKALEKKARNAGQTPAEFARHVLEAELFADQTFDELLAPVRADFQKKGMTEADVDALVKRARAATSKQRRSRS